MGKITEGIRTFFTTTSTLDYLNRDAKEKANFYEMTSSDFKQGAKGLLPALYKTPDQRKRAAEAAEEDAQKAKENLNKSSTYRRIIERRRRFHLPPW